MKFAPIAALELRHPYYADSRCEGLKIRPSDEGERTLRRHRLQLRERGSGVLLLAPVDNEGTPLFHLDPSTRLHFELHVRDPAFTQFTDLSALAELSAPLFTNQDAPTGGELKLGPRSASAREKFSRQGQSANESFVLGGRPRSGITIDDFLIDGDPAPSLKSYDPETRMITLEYDGFAVGKNFTVRYPIAVHGPRGALAEIAIQDTQETWRSNTPAIFTLTFKPRQVRWIYYLVTDVDPGVFTIVDAGPDNAVVQFSEENRRDLNAEPDPDDPQALALAAHYPDLRRLRFTSDALIACSEVPRRKLQLQLDGESLPITLPNPPLANYTSREAIDEQPQERQESLFRVVKHLTSQTTANG